MGEHWEQVESTGIMGEGGGDAMARDDLASSLRSCAQSGSHSGTRRPQMWLELWLHGLLDVRLYSKVQGRGEGLQHGIKKDLLLWAIHRSEDKNGEGATI